MLSFARCLIVQRPGRGKPFPFINVHSLNPRNSSSISSPLSFDHFLQQTLVFVQAHGRLPRRREEIKGEQKLSKFLGLQRKNCFEGKLSTEQIRLMETIPGFKWAVRYTLEENVTKVCEFHKKYGSLPVRKGKRDNGDETYLAAFLNRIRQKHRRAKLTDQEIWLMETIPNFLWCEILQFDEFVEEVQAFIEKFGEFPKSTLGADRQVSEDRPSEFELARFLSRVRQEKRMGTLAKDRQDTLEALDGFRWRTHGSFHVTAEALHQFCTRYKRLPKYGAKDDEERSLSLFIAMNRARKLSNTLSEERIRVLENVPHFEWVTRTPFRQYIKDLAAFVKENKRLPQYGNSNSNRNMPERRLCRFLTRERQALRAGRLTPKRRKGLCSIPILVSEFSLRLPSSSSEEEDLQLGKSTIVKIEEPPSLPSTP